MCKVSDYSLVNLSGEFVFTGATPEEKSLLCRTEDVPANAEITQDGFAGFYIEGTLDFSLAGILARITAVLAYNGVSVFAVLTFTTDYIFVKQENRRKAAGALAEAGYEVIQ